MGGAAGIASLASGHAMAKTGPAKPNIVFFLADDLGYADVSCYGRPDIETPAIRPGLPPMASRFLQGYANSAVCSATRTALITGRYQYRLEVGLEEPVAGSSHNVGRAAVAADLALAAESRRLWHDVCWASGTSASCQTMDR